MEDGRERPLHEDLALLAALTARRAVDDNGCWRWLGARTTGGYGQVRRECEVRYVHRLSAELFLDLDPGSGLYVLHRCDNRACFNPEHLSLGSQADNIRDAVLKGRMGKKLSTEAVTAIKRLLAQGEARALIARHFAVSTETIGDIARGQTWKHIPWPASEPK